MARPYVGTVSTIVSKLSGFSSEISIQDGRNFSFSWDKKTYSEDYLDLRDFANFFKVKNFRDFQKICPEEYSAFQKQSVKIRRWVGTFEKVPGRYFDSFEVFPPLMASQYLEARNALWHAWLTSIRKNHIYEPWLSYYTSHRASFDLLRDMEYSLQTIHGKQHVDLLFAENFRFKSAPESLNIFNMRKELRDCIIPQGEDHFIYMADFRQFEFRTALMLAGADVDYDDKDLYGTIGSKLGKSKVDLIAYLYSDRDDKQIEKVVDKNKIISKMREDHFVWREFPVFFNAASERKKKIHSIIQTVSYFIYLEKFAKVLELLKDKRSSLVFPLHDAMIFSVSASELELLDEIPKLLVDDVYLIKQYIGKNLKETEEL